MPEPAIESARRSAIARFFREFPVRWAMDVMGMKSAHVAVTLVLSSLVALFDGVMLAILIPVAQGLFAGSFMFMSNWPGVRWAHASWPGLVENYSHMFLFLASAAFLAGVARGVCLYFQTLVSEKYFGHYSTRLTSFLFQRYLQFGKAYFDRHNAGNLAATIDYHFDLFSLFRGLLRMVSESLALLAYLAVMLLISWRLTLAVLLVIPVAFAIRRWIAHHIRRPSEQAQLDSMGIVRQLYLVLTSAPHFQAFSNEASALRAYSSVAERYRASNLRIWLFRALIGPVQDVSTLLILLVVLCLAFVVEGDGSRQVAGFFVFFFVARLALPRFNTFNQVELDFEQKLPRVRLMFEVFSDEGKFIVPSGKRSFTGLEKQIEFRGLCFAYPGGPEVLHDVSFRINKGCMTALVGPSGAGKSTLTQLLLRFYDIEPGQLLMDEVDIREYSIESLRRHLALVNQDVALLNDSLRNNLVFGLKAGADDEALHQVLQDACLEETVAGLPDGLDTMLGDRGLTLSGGQRQRLAIARAMLRKAPILILDEATSSLDSRTEREVQNAIDNAVHGCTSIVIAHRLSTIQKADWVMVMHEGRVVEQGSLDQLLAQPGLFRELWQAQKFD